MRLWHLIGLGVVAAISASSALAQSGIYVEFQTPSLNDGWSAVPGFPNRYTGQAGLPSGSDITISNPNSLAYRVYAVSPTTTDIGDVRCDATSTQPTLFVGRPSSGYAVNPGIPLASAGARNIGSISVLGGSLQVRVVGNVGGASGTSCRSLARIDANTVTASVTHNSGAVSGAGALGAVTASGSGASISGSIRSFGGDIALVSCDGPISSSISISSAGGHINSINCTQLTGSVIAAAGRINSITVSGDIGTSSTPVNISAAGNFNNVGTVQAATIYANITTTANPTAQGNTVRLVGMTGGYFGSLITYAMQGSSLGVPALQLNGPLGANLSVYKIGRPISASSLAPNKTITAWEELKADAPITLGDHGLQGQIILNAFNTTSPSLAWAGDITINNATPITLTGSNPDYEIASSDLGGGSVGLAPFMLNRADCEPASMCHSTPCFQRLGFIGHNDFATNGVKLRFYGPVGINSSISPTLHVYQTDLYGTMTTSNDLVAAGLLVVQAESGNARGVVIKPATGVTLLPNTRYIVVRNGSGIRSLTGVLPVTNTPAVADFIYNFYIANQGDGGHTGDWVCGTSDYNGDGDFGTDADIEAFFACLAGSCCANCCACGSDFNGDGDFGTDLDIEAFFRVLSGGGCAP